MSAQRGLVTPTLKCHLTVDQQRHHCDGPSLSVTEPHSLVQHIVCVDDDGPFNTDRKCYDEEHQHHEYSQLSHQTQRNFWRFVVRFYSCDSSAEISVQVDQHPSSQRRIQNDEPPP